MNRHLFFLLFRSARGRLVRGLRLLRQPKYLIGLLITAGWLGIWLLPEVLSPRENAGFPAAERIIEFVPAVQLLTALTLALLVTIWWLVPIGKPALGLTEAEIEMLSPTPLRRRHLIQYSIVKSQPAIFVGCLVMTIFLPFRSWSSGLYHLLAVWLLLSLWDLHSRGRRLHLGGIRQMKPPRAAARWALIYLIPALYWVALIGSLATHRAWVGEPVANFEEFIRQLSLAAIELRQGMAGWLLLPFLCLTDPFAVNLSSAGPAQRLAALFLPTLLLGLHNEWVVRSRTRFEEATLEAARRRDREKGDVARHLRQAKRVRRRVPFVLQPTGPAETGVVWKNLIMIRRTPLKRQAMIGGLSAALVGLLIALFPTPGWVVAIPSISGLILLLFFPLLGPNNWRNDLRTDLQRVEAIRPWPIPGWRLAAAEALGPAALGLMCALLGAALVAAVDLGALLGGRDLQMWGEAFDRASRLTSTPRPLLIPLSLLGLLFVSAGVAYFSALLQGFAALAFPGWVPLGPVRKQAAANAGHNMLMGLLLMLAMALGSVPGLLLAGLVVFVQSWLGIPLTAWEFPFLGLLAALPFFLLSGLLIAASGKLWEELDASAELLTR